MAKGYLSYRLFLEVDLIHALPDLCSNGFMEYMHQHCCNNVTKFSDQTIVVYCYIWLYSLPLLHLNTEA